MEATVALGDGCEEIWEGVTTTRDTGAGPPVYVLTLYGPYMVYFSDPDLITAVGSDFIHYFH